MRRNKDDRDLHAGVCQPALEIEPAHLRQPYIQNQAARVICTPRSTGPLSAGRSRKFRKALQTIDKLNHRTDPVFEVSARSRAYGLVCFPKYSLSIVWAHHFSYYRYVNGVFLRRQPKDAIGFVRHDHTIRLKVPYPNRTRRGVEIWCPFEGALLDLHTCGKQEGIILSYLSICRSILGVLARRSDPSRRRGPEPA